jgi:hypothetical protein
MVKLKKKIDPKFKKSHRDSNKICKIQQRLAIKVGEGFLVLLTTVKLHDEVVLLGYARQNDHRIFHIRLYAERYVGVQTVADHACSIFIQIMVLLEDVEHVSMRFA